MCTLTLAPTSDGYVVGMNRDEKLTRPKAAIPKRWDLQNAEAIYPSEPSGGTWIACNGHGILLALLNWNDLALKSSTVQLKSRGTVIPQLIKERDSVDVSRSF